MTSRRERQTLIPAFDPAELARRTTEDESPTMPPPDPSAYARIVGSNVAETAEHEGRRETPRTLTAATPVSDEHAMVADIEAVGRAMYGSFLESDFPEALVLAERVLAEQPDHALAQAVVDRCRAVLSLPPTPLLPSSVVRLRSSPEDLATLVLDETSEAVLAHVDGVSDAAAIAKRSGVSRIETMDRLSALMNLGVVEVLSA